jgi:outer membrane protein OmpA-like peptidoglycan-associated protein
MLHENNSETNELECEVNGEIKHELRSNAKSFQMPANQVAAEFGEVNVWRNMPEENTEIGECRVEFTIAMEPQGRFAEGWRTGLALDASASMKRAYGRKVEARVDPELLTDYIKQGRLRAYLEDGEPTRKIQREAFAEIQERGYEINYTENILQPLVQNFTAYLAGSLDRTGKTSLIYWGCGKGDEIQVLGEFDALSCQKLAIAGPATFQLGKTTKLLPAIAHFVNGLANGHSPDSHSQAQRGMYIFLTDGRIDDLEEVKNYTKELALEIAVGKRNYLKLILIGIGNDVDRYQMQELDDFDTGLDIDLWDYKIASEMTSLSQIFAEVVNENQIIAENGAIYDDAGNCVKTYVNGLPAKVDFVMRDDSQWFELEVSNQRIRQAVVLGAAIAPLAKKELFDFETKVNERDRDVAVINQTEESSSWWKILAALLIGAAFIGTAIAFGVLIKRSDDSKFQKQSIPTVIKESVLESKSPSNQVSSDKVADNFGKSSKATPDSSGNNSEKPTVNSPTKTTSLNNTNNLGTNQNLTTQSNQSKSSDRNNRNVNTSILPIANPEIETTIFFPSDESQLRPPEEIKIDNFWAKIQGKRGIVQVSGHTDTTGEYAYNLDLSQARANEVVRLLRDRGLDNNYKITFEALSWVQPLRKNNTATDKAFNRRVVIQFKEQR